MSSKAVHGCPPHSVYAEWFSADIRDSLLMYTEIPEHQEGRVASDSSQCLSLFRIRLTEGSLCLHPNGRYSCLCLVQLESLPAYPLCQVVLTALSPLHMALL